MPTQQLCEFLDQNQVKYVVISHSPAYTMSEIAATAHISGKKVVKTVIVKMDSEMAMLVLPSNPKVDFDHLKELTGSESVELAKEQEFKDRFPGCEVGAMPPFGNLYGLEVYISPELAQSDDIVFNAGSHADVMQLAYEDFARLVNPKVPATSFGALAAARSDDSPSHT